MQESICFELIVLFIFTNQFKNNNVMKKSALFLSGIFLLFVIMSTFSCIKGKGDIVIDTFIVNPFTGIANEIAADIHVTQGSVQSVEIHAQANIMNNISLKVSNGILKIGFIRDNVYRFDPIDIYITIPKLSDLIISGSGMISTTSMFDSCGTVTLAISGSGDIDADFNAFIKTHTSITGSGDITVTGMSPEHSIIISGSGNINSFPFHTKHTDVNISGSGSCELSADSTLNVVISGSGSVYYKGHPVVNSHITGSGTIHDSN
jgi:hypothetical protein